MTNNYIIAVDEIGQPFITHAFGDTPGYGRQKKNHKYIARVRDGLKWRYFYTIDEYEAYMRDLRDSSAKKYNRAKKSIQTNPNLEREFSDKELRRIEIRSDSKIAIAKHRYDQARDRYDNLKHIRSAKPEDKKRAQEQMERALLEYELMRDIM